MISCVVLTAGLSSRFGSPKALACLKQYTVIEHISQMLINLPVHEIIVVLGSHAQEIKPFILKHTKLKVVYNKNYNFGQTSSFKVALENLSPEASGIMLLPIDYPFIQQETLKRLTTLFYEKSPSILIPTYGGRKGHPPIFHINLKDDFLTLDHSFGINSVIHKYEKHLCLVSVDDAGVVKSFNTKEEFESLKRELL